jgi:hypothetical protein
VRLSHRQRRSSARRHDQDRSGVQHQTDGDHGFGRRRRRGRRQQLLSLKAGTGRNFYVIGASPRAGNHPRDREEAKAPGAAQFKTQSCNGEMRHQKMHMHAALKPGALLIDLALELMMDPET